MLPAVCLVTYAVVKTSGVQSNRVSKQLTNCVELVIENHRFRIINSIKTSSNMMNDPSWKLPPVNGNRRLRFTDGISRFWNNLRRHVEPMDGLICPESKSDDETDRDDSDTIWTLRDNGRTSNGALIVVSGMRKAGSEMHLLPPLIMETEKTAGRAIAEMGIAFLGRPVTCTNRTRHLRPLAAYPDQIRMKSMELAIMEESQLKDLIERAKDSRNYTEVSLYYTSAFSSFQDLNDAFAFPDSTKYSFFQAQTTSGLNLALLKAAYDFLMDLPSEIQKATLKSVINCLLSDQRNVDTTSMRHISPDDIRAYLILLQNPQFRRTSTYVVFAHLLRLVATLCEADQQMLSDWMTELQPVQFRFIVQTIQTFISIRMFPPRPQDLPPNSKCTWWIPSAVRTLAILNVANNSKHLVHFSDFYNSAIDHWDLMGEFHAWETPALSSNFSFCQYPFILSINAKKVILEGHAAEQMIATARDSLIGNMGTSRRMPPDMDILFLNITVRRSHLVQDSLKELFSKQDSLRKKLRVQFAGEQGVDMGGLTKEWFQLLIHQIFNPDFGMFVYHKKSEVFWFRNSGTDRDRLREYHLIGVLMGLAVYNGVILDIHFPRCCFKKLLSPPIVPRLIEYGFGGSRLGICNSTLEDLEGIVPDTVRGLKELLDYEGDVEEDFGLSFEASVDEFGEVYTEELQENGQNIPVTKENREDYVKAYVEWFVNRSVFHQFKAFYLGFHSVCASNALLLLRAEEVELLVCGSQDFDMSDLKKVTTYDGYKSDHKTIRHFWDLVLRLPVRHQRRLLTFATGTDRIPAGGMKEMSFKIVKMPDAAAGNGKTTDMIPIAHTCFNQLVLPDYQDRRVLRQKLAIALAHGEGFGLE